MAATGSPAFTRARDFLLAHRTDYPTAYRDFRWPVLSQFNWALDHFDPMARGNDATALHIVDEGGGEVRRSFAQMAERSDQVANWLRAQGVKRGDRVLLMLGNELALWELMLACIKLGAVMIPATMLLTPTTCRTGWTAARCATWPSPATRRASLPICRAATRASPSAPRCRAG